MESRRQPSHAWLPQAGCHSIPHPQPRQFSRPGPDDSGFSTQREAANGGLVRGRGRAAARAINQLERRPRPRPAQAQLPIVLGPLLPGSPGIPSTACTGGGGRQVGSAGHGGLLTALGPHQTPTARPRQPPAQAPPPAVPRNPGGAPGRPQRPQASGSEHQSPTWEPQGSALGGEGPPSSSTPRTGRQAQGCPATCSVSQLRGFLRSWPPQVSRVLPHKFPGGPGPPHGQSPLEGPSTPLQQWQPSPPLGGPSHHHCRRLADPPGLEGLPAWGRPVSPTRLLSHTRDGKGHQGEGPAWGDRTESPADPEPLRQARQQRWAATGAKAALGQQLGH